MRSFRAIGLIMLAVGLAALTIGLLNNEVDVFLLLVIPVFQLSGPWSAGGALLIIFSLMVLVLSPFSSSVQISEEYRGTGMREEKESRIRSGGVILIGPIPIIWGESGISRRMWPLLIAIGLALTLLLLFFFR